MSLSNDEVLELLNEKYTAEQIAIAFSEMAKRGYNVSPKDDQFDEQTVEVLEALLGAASSGIEQQRKALPQFKGEKSNEQVVNEAIELAQVQLKGFGVDSRLTGAIIQSVFQEQIRSMVALNHLRQKVAAAVWDEANTAIAEGLIQSSRRETKFLEDLAGNNEAVTRMLNGYGVTGGGGQRLIEQSRVNASTAKSNFKAYLAESNESIPQFEATPERPMLPHFDLMAYLEEEIEG